MINIKSQKMEVDKNKKLHETIATLKRKYGYDSITNVKIKRY